MKMKRKIYIETTVVSYLTARPSRDINITAHQVATRDIWPALSNKYEAYISALVYEEARHGDSEQAKLRLAAIETFPMLEIDDEAKVLAETIIAKKGIPIEYPEDALHIALAAVNGIEIVITWNFAHLSNPFIRKILRRIIEGEGYECPEICSPEELLEVRK
jgi:predicted nucleic acid-binding protein